MPEPTRIGDARLVWGSKTYVMGVINVTPDSFSGDGLGSDVDSAIWLGKSFQEWGADMVDVGGESTRPSSIYAGAGPASVDEELTRVLPVIEALETEIDIPVSIDTYKAAVAEKAVAAGADMINDVWGFVRDPDMARVAAEARVPVVLMHNQGLHRVRRSGAGRHVEAPVARGQGRRRRGGLREHHPRPGDGLRQDGRA